MNNNFDDEKIMEELESMLSSVFDAEKQYELYCELMKEMFLAGSNNN